MRTFYRFVFLCIIGNLFVLAQEVPAVDPKTSSIPVKSISWSLVYLPSIEWSETEIADALTIINDLKPNLVLSLTPCTYADQIRKLACKPQLLDRNERSKNGIKSGTPSNPHSRYIDTSTRHSIIEASQETPNLVWLSSEEFNGNGSYGPKVNVRERDALADFQIREQMTHRQGEVIFLLDTDASIADENQWSVPWNHVRYQQAPNSMTGYTCIRPATLQTHIAAIDGIATRVPVIHRIRSGANGMEWEVFPIDGRPAIQHHTIAKSERKINAPSPKVQCLKAPKVPDEVPLWMDEYVNQNPALETGKTIRRGSMSRLFRWNVEDFRRDSFHLLHANHHPVADPTMPLPELERGAVRSPSNRFSITVGQLDGNGWYPCDGDDGINVYLNDRRMNKSHLVYFQGLYGAWPSAATWFTDRYVITSGTAIPVDEYDDETGYEGSNEAPTTLYLLDLQTGKAFSTNSYAPTSARLNAPTERIFFPDASSYETQVTWKFLWQTVEAGYRIKPQEAPISIDQAIKDTQLSSKPNARWKDLGIWPSPETWKMIKKKDQEWDVDPKKIMKNAGDSFLTYTEISQGQRQYRLAISSFSSGDFGGKHTLDRIVASADLFITGEGHMPQLKSVKRFGDSEQLLLLGGIYLKPNSEEGNWILLMDQSQLRAWSAHW